MGAIAPVPAILPIWNGPLADNVPASLNGLVAHPNGAVTPAETPSVLAARRDHLIAKDAAYAAAAPIIAAPLAVPAGPIAAPLAAPAIAPIAPIAPFPLADSVPASLNGLVAHPNGAVTPVETPSVSAARLDHLAAKDSAYAAAAPIIAAPLALPAGPIAAPLAAPAITPIAPAGRGLGGFLPGLGPTGGLVSHPNGAVVPADEPAVAAARGAHLAHFG